MTTILIILLTFVASCIGTMTGFGTSTIMVPILSLFFPLPETLLFVGIIHWFGNLWKMVFFKKGFNVTLALLFGIPGIAASFFAARLPLGIPETILKPIFGIFLMTYVIFLFYRSDWKIEPSVRTAALGGALSGFSAAVFGVGGAIRSTFLTAFDLEKSVFIFTSGFIGFLIDSSRLSQYVLSGTKLPANLANTLFAALPASFAGAYLAKRVVDKIPQQAFRLLIAGALLLVGLYSVVQGFLK